MSAHTPGPWRVSKERGVRYVVEQNGGAIVHVGSQNDGIDNAAKELEADANARLIAAAPELLAALQEAEVYLRGMTAPNALAAKSLIDAAIAKATGAA